MPRLAQHHPPRLAQALLKRLGGIDANLMAADLAEEYRRYVRPFRGALRSRWWYWGQVVRSIVSSRGVGFDHASKGEMRMGILIESTAKDVVFALRGLARRPAFAITTVLSLSLGIGGVVGAYGILEGSLLAPLPYDHPDDLVVFWDGGSWSEAEALALRSEQDALWPRAFWSDEHTTLQVGDGPARAVRNVRASQELFETLGRTPAMGRGFAPGEDEPGAAPVVVLSWSLWTELGSDSSMVGSRVVLSGVPHEVVGVMPRDFYFPDREVRLWTPLPLHADGRGLYLAAVARGDHDAPASRIAAQLERLTSVLSGRFAYSDGPDKTRNPSLTPLSTRLRGDTRRPALLIYGALILLLLLACANVTALVLARTESRAAEFAMRRALGAGSVRIDRQLATEAIVLGGMSGITAPLVASVVFRLLRISLPLPAGAADALSIGPWILGTSILTGLAASLLVAGLSVAGRARAGQVHWGGARVVGKGRGGSHIEAGLVVVQVAVGLLLTGGTGLAVRSVRALSRVDPGIEAEGRLAIDVIAPLLPYAPFNRRAPLFDAVLDRVRQVPGVASAGLTQLLPLRGMGWFTSEKVPGREEPLRTYMRFVSSGYVEAIGMRVAEGRSFVATDRAGTESVAMVNRTAARRLWGDASPVGRTVDVGGGEARVVGVVEDVKESHLIDAPEAAVYEPFAQRPMNLIPTIVVSTRRPDPMVLSGALRQAVHEAAPDVGVLRVTRLTDVVRDAEGPIRAVLPVIGALSVLALVLGAIGVYGMLSHDVSVRTRRWAVSLALGADRKHVTWSVVARGMSLVGLGCLVGTIGFYSLARVAEGLVFGIASTDPVALGGAILALCLVGLLATWIPGRRAAATDPMLTLRGDG